MIGQTIGPYQILAKLGAGGMGEVYRARDSKLKREVAIKVLPADVANDRERLARFQREAEVLASLNHPHIAHVYGIEDNALVMELVEGEDLSQRVARGAIPIDEALPIAKQIAEALEAAHDAGIIHRDLKPANIKVREDGTVKVLDFGLAKALDEPKGSSPHGVSQDLANSPTITSPAMTMRGVILGTAAYMAPEQAKGKAVDKRADIWAFGCVLFEMLSGKRAFKGDDVTDIITSVMRDTPDWNALPAATPQTIRTLLRRCIEKDPRQRAPHIAIARMEIADALSSSGDRVADQSATAPSRRAWPLALGVGVAMAVAASTVTLLLTRADTPNDPVAPVLRYSITLPTPTPGSNAAVSPDGRFLAIAGRDASGARRVWIRALDGAEFVTVAGAGDGGDFPFWSPDSKELAFFAGQKLFRISTNGGAPQQISDLTAIFTRTNQAGGAATWGKDGTILFSGPDGIYRVAARGGPFEKVSPANAASGVTVWSNFTFPQWLSGQRSILYSTFGTSVAFGVGNIGALIHQPLNGTPTQVTASPRGSRAQVTAHGVLIARVDNAASADLRLHQFDAATGKLDEPGIVISADASLNFSASDAGVLVYRRGLAGTPVKFEWVDDAGRTTGDAFDSAGTGPFSLSKDESLLAFGEAGSIKVRDLRRGVTMTLVQGGVETVFSPDGRRIAYALLAPGRPRIVVQPASGGPAEVVYESDLTTLPEDWSSDGKYLAANEAGRRGLIVALDGKQQPIVYADVAAGPASIDEPRFSPDGKWLVYNAAEGGRHEVFLIPLPPTGERLQVSLAGGSQGRWRRDGSALYYLAADGALMKVEVKLAPGGRPELSRPRQLFATGLTPTTNIDQFAPNANGTRFLLRRPQRGDIVERLDVIANWPALVKAGAK